MMTKNPDQLHWEQTYTQPLDQIPWEITTPPQILVELIKNKTITPTLTLDIACGTGNYSIYLAQNGFQVIGVDYVERALEQAVTKNQAAQTDAVFIQADVRQLTQVIKSQFGFILDYSLLHHLSDTDVAAYTSQFPSLLQNQGKLLVVCYTPQHHRSQGNRQVTGKYGNTMFFRREDEIRELYKDLNQVWYQKTTLGKENEHPAHAFLFEKS